MQRCSFSETQFVFQYVFEHYNRYKFSPFPFFPDTVAEGKYYGFDICIGNLFFQFKVANQYTALDGKSKSTIPLWNAFKTDNYQIIIKASDIQFKLLSRIASNTKYSNSVYYVAPCFHTKIDLIHNYNHKTIIDNTAHFKVNDFPKHLKGQHKLVYTATSKVGILFSEPSEILLSKNIIENNFEPLQNRTSLRDVAYDIRDAVLNLNGNLIGLTTFQDKDLPQIFVKQMQAVLLNEYDIHWFPLIDLNRLSHYA